MISPKRNKSLKFNRVEKHNFKNAKRLSINKSINDINNIIIYEHSPSNKKDRKRQSQLSPSLNVAKHIDENNSPTKNKNPLKTMKKLHSSNKIQMIRFKDFLKKKSFFKKEEQKNETNNNLPIVLKLEQKNIGEAKKYTSSNNIAHIFKSYSKELFKNINRKNRIKNNNEIENENTNYDINNVVKIKKKKKEIKEIPDNKEIMDYKHSKKGKEHKDKKDHKNKKENHENKSKKEIKQIKLNEGKKEDEKEKSLNNVKCKFFCCL